MIGTPALPASPALCRRLMRAADRAILATNSAQSGDRAGGAWPYASLVLVGCDHDASPVLLVSDLAEHTKNLRADPRVSLLFDGTAGLDDPLTGPRASLQGEAAPVDDDVLLRRYVRRHPSAEQYAGFRDFHLVRIRPVRAHLVAGFGRINWIEAGDLMFDASVSAALRAAEEQLVATLNADRTAVLDRIASRRLGRQAAGWRLVGIDPEGVDLRAGGELARCDFPDPVATAAAAAAAVHRLAEAG